MPGLEDVLSGAAAIATPPVTALSIVRCVRRRLEDEPWQDVLTAGYTAGSGTISLAQPGMWSEGQTVEIDDSYGSQMYITSTGVLVNPIAVAAGHNNTSDVNHNSGTIVLQEPRFPYDIIYDTIGEVTSSEPPHWMWTTNSVVITPSTATTLYQAPADFFDLIGATQKTNSSSLVEVNAYGVTGGRPISIERNLPIAVIPTTVAFRFPSGFYNMTENVTVYYRARLTLTTIPDGDIADYICLRSCERLLGAKEVPLSAMDQSAPVPPPGTAPGNLLRNSLWFKSQADALRRQIKVELLTQVPPARVWHW